MTHLLHLCASPRGAIDERQSAIAAAYEAIQQTITTWRTQFSAL